MASLLKNQILKHLSKFAKNLSIDQINLSALQGRGELKDLELNEAVLMDLLELPSWLRLTKAVCNKVSIKIQWTKLKSVPLYLCLDEVYVEIETCEKLRHVFDQVIRPSYRSGGSYGFSDMVIDGVTVSVNSIDIRFKSSAFNASFQLSRVKLESRTPNWHRTNDLRATKLKDAERGELLIFKELEWQTLKMEASAIDKNAEVIAPLRLITNQARCRITIKKRLQDGGILASRLVFIMDDLLWVLTDTQIQAAIHFVSSLLGLISKAVEHEKRITAVQKLELQLSQQQQSQQHQANKGAGKAQSEISRVFNMYEILETSIHVYSSRIDVHFCDDCKPGESRSTHPHLVHGGAMQITLTRLAVDYYPYHLVYSNRKHWLRYNDSDTSQSDWVEKLLSNYCRELLDLIQGDGTLPKSSSTSPQQENISQNQDERRRSSGQSKLQLVTTFLKRLMSSCVVVRLDDFVIHQISTASTQKKMPDKFISSDKGRLMLPATMPAIHIEITDYYFPGDDNFPVPVSSVYTHVNPVQLYIDPVTIIWLSSFVLNIKPIQSLTMLLDTEYKPLDIYLEALMPRIVIPGPKDSPAHDDRPRSMQIQISRFVVTNCRVGINCGRQQLLECLDAFQTRPLLMEKSFPYAKNDVDPIMEAFILHAEDLDNVNPCSGGNESHSSLRKELLWTENKSIWCFQMEPIWADFCGVESCQNRPSPFVEAVQVACWVAQTLWCPGKQLTTVEDGSEIDRVHALVHFKSLVSIQLNRYQYLFLLRASEMLSSMMIQLTKDSQGMGQKAVSVCVATILPEVDLFVLVPVKKPFDAAADANSLRGDLSSSTTTTNNIGANVGGSDAATSTAYPIRESHSQGCINNETAGHILTSSSSDFNLGSTPIERSPQLSFLEENAENKKLDAVIDSRSEGSISLEDESRSGIDTTESQNRRKDSVLFTKKTDSVDTNDSEMAHEITISAATNAAKPTNVMGSLKMSNKIKGLFTQDGASPSNRSSSFDNFVAVIDKTGLEKVPDQLGKSIVSGSRSIKKGFTKAFATIDSTIINPMIKSSSSPGSGSVGPSSSIGISPSSTENSSLLATPHDVEDFDSMSMCSDISDDQYVLLNAEGTFLDENLFHFDTTDRHTIEMGSEAKEESGSEPSRSIASSFKRQDLMQVVTFRLGMVDAIFHSLGLDTVAKFQVHYLQSVEDGTMTWEEFQIKFSAGSRGWQEEAMKYTLPTCDVRARYEKGSKMGSIDPQYEDIGYLRAILRDATLILMSSSLTHLSETFKDEVSLPPIPMKLAVCNVKVHLEEDRSFQSSNTATSEPSVLELSNLKIVRKSDGIVQVNSGTITDITSEFEDEALKRPGDEVLDKNDRILNLEKENEVLREIVMSLRLELQRSGESRRHASDIEAELSMLNEKKASLLATLMVLQEEISTSKDTLTNHKHRDE